MHKRSIFKETGRLVLRASSSVRHRCGESNRSRCKVISVDPSGLTSRKDLRMKSKGDLWMDVNASASILRGLSAASVLEIQGSGDFLSHDGSLPSCSSSSSERNSPADLIDGAAEDIAILEDGEVRTMLQDAEVRSVLRKVTINEGVLNKAIQSLGGGEKGLKSLMEYIMVWVKQQRDIQSSSQQLPVPPPPSNPAWNFSTAHHVVLHPSSDAFQILSGILQPPPTTQVLDQEMRYTQRLKSRKLMTGKPELGAGLGGLDTGFCPSSFISSPEDCKPEVTNSGIMAPCIPQLNHGMQQQQQQPVTPFTSARIAMPSVEPTPAMTSKAARRHRMTRQRQSFPARAASPVARAPVSVGGESLWNTNAAAPPAVASSGISGVQTTPRSAPVTAAWEGRSMECLTVLLQKELRPSDVGHLGRIVLPKKEAEERMPSLATRGAVSIQMEDFDSGHTWNLRYKFWPNNESRMYILENTAAFVMSHGLVEGDLIVIYSVLQGGYVLRGMKKKNGRLAIEPVQVEFAHSLAKGSLQGQPSLHENGKLVQRLDGCFPSDKSVNEEPANLDDDPFLNDVILSMGPSLKSDSSCIQTLERFPSLTLDFPFEEIMALAKTEPDGT